MSIVISIDDLMARAGDGIVVFDIEGNVVEVDWPGLPGPATLLVSEVTDALKTVDDRGAIVESLDRSQAWVVDAIALSAEVLSTLAGEMAVADLLVAVPAAGFEWEVSPTSGP